MAPDVPEPPTPPEPPAGSSVSGGAHLEGHDVDVGHDVAGRDIVETTTNVGFSPEAVQRLIITVGVLVFVTAACFFSGGIAVGAGILALQKPVSSNVEAGNRAQAKLEQVSRLPPGQPFQLTLTEDELSSYIRFIAGPQIGLSEGKARLLAPGELVIGGRLSSLGNIPIAATFKVQDNAAQPLRLEAAAIQVLPLNGSFGWVAVPAGLLQPFADQANQFIARNYRVIGINEAPAAQPAWTIRGVAR